MTRARGNDVILLMKRAARRREIDVYGLSRTTRDNGHRRPRNVCEICPYRHCHISRLEMRGNMTLRHHRVGHRATA